MNVNIFFTGSFTLIVLVHASAQNYSFDQSRVKKYGEPSIFDHHHRHPVHMLEPDPAKKIFHGPKNPIARTTVSPSQITSDRFKRSGKSFQYYNNRSSNISNSITAQKKKQLLIDISTMLRTSTNEAIVSTTLNSVLGAHSFFNTNHETDKADKKQLLKIKYTKSEEALTTIKSAVNGSKVHNISSFISDESPNSFHQSAKSSTKKSSSKEEIDSTSEDDSFEDVLYSTSEIFTFYDPASENMLLNMTNFPTVTDVQVSTPNLIEKLTVQPIGSRFLHSSSMVNDSSEQEDTTKTSSYMVNNTSMEVLNISVETEATIPTKTDNLENQLPVTKNQTFNPVSINHERRFTIYTSDTPDDTSQFQNNNLNSINDAILHNKIYFGIDPLRPTRKLLSGFVEHETD